MVSRAQQGLSWGLMRSMQALGKARMEWSSCAMLCPETASHSRPSSGSQLQPCVNKPPSHWHVQCAHGSTYVILLPSRPAEACMHGGKSPCKGVNVC